ncbi:hypothetical protein I0C86_17125 [Plantactinospora sp. S1510]|uniref:Uncharacterized protein n=1 Tax=Plantactinospora alkalitolerans TaxID=2789879 RepID=A0ABS0GWU7_9ACTN|nr:hypothetical protein [Plantactinospora alkalitolerans]MBF9130667.1 hypothetical protein [Plantactinospora alkalitolerans]
MNVRQNGPARTRRILAGVNLAAAAVLASQLVVVAPAQAVPGLVRVQTTGPVNSAWKTTNAQCPAGTTVLGGGGRINTASGQVVMDTMLPLNDGSAYSVTGREDDNGFAGSWSITTVSLCAPAPAGLETEAMFSPDNSTNKSVTLPCTAGKKALGVGGELSGGLGQVILEELRPDANLSSVTVTGAEDANGYAANWSIAAKAICVTPPASLQRVAGPFGLLDSTGVKTNTATCPSGTRVHGVGGEIEGGAGQVRMTGVLATSTTSVTVTGMEDENGFAGNWGVRAYAVCA